MPPFGYLDLDGLRDEKLLREVRRVRPSLHFFGHIHAGYGKGTSDAEPSSHSLGQRGYGGRLQRYRYTCAYNGADLAHLVVP